MNTGDLVATADIPGGGQLYLMQSGQDFEIVFEGEQLMGSWCHGSERALATLAYAEIGDRGGEVLVGGLGMGFTLAAALEVMPEQAKITVAELVPDIVAWARGPLAHIHVTSLDDPRVTLEVRDVHDLIAEREERFDAILLDVDNGPDGLIQLANERLYCSWGIRAARAALKPGGVLAIWSAYGDPTFRSRLSEAGFDVSEAEFDEDPDNGPHTIWLAAKTD
jgi:spermidine synthase